MVSFLDTFAVLPPVKKNTSSPLIFVVVVVDVLTGHTMRARVELSTLFFSPLADAADSLDFKISSSSDMTWGLISKKKRNEEKAENEQNS